MASKTKTKTFEAGARVRYTGKWLRNTGQQTGSAGQRRGTVTGPVPGMSADVVGVRWDDEDLSAYDADPEYQAHVKAHGVAVNAGNLQRAR